MEHLACLLGAFVGGIVMGLMMGLSYLAVGRLSPPRSESVEEVPNEVP